MSMIRRRPALTLLTLAIVAVVVPAGAAAAEPMGAVTASGYRVIDLGTLGGGTSRGEAINDRGQVVGSAEAADGHSKAFLWQGHQMRSLGTLGGTESGATDINDRGQVVGWSGSAADTTHGFLWSGGRMRDLGMQAAGPLYINAHGVIAGTGADSHGEYAFVWRDGRLTRLERYGLTGQSFVTGINDAGDIVGGDGLGLGPVSGRPFVLHHGHLMRPDVMPGLATITAIGAINDRGDYAGSLTISFRQHAAMVRQGRLVDLGSLDPTGAAGSNVVGALGLNDRGVVVGRSATATSPDGHAFVWTAARGIQDLGVVYDHGAGDRSWAVGVNAAGTVVGTSVVRAHPSMDDDGWHAVLWVPVQR